MSSLIINKQTNSEGEIIEGLMIDVGQLMLQSHGEGC